MFLIICGCIFYFCGLKAVAFTDQAGLYEGTGFTNADATLEKYYQYDVERYEEEIKVKQDQWTDDQRDAFSEYRMNDSEASVLFSVDIMHNGIDKGVHSVNIRICVCVKDAPYHRQYDDMFEFDLTFRTDESFQRQLKKLLKNKDVKQLIKNLREAY